MSAAWLPHVVRAGEYTTALAGSRGVTKKVVWSHSKNADLAQRRKSADVLLPGDIIYLPAKLPQGLDVNAQAENEYRLTVPEISVHVLLKDTEGKPLANEDVEISGATSEPARTDGSGSLLLAPEPQVPLVRVKILRTGAIFDVRIGHLDPHDSGSGARSRLRQLGFLGDEEQQVSRRAVTGASSGEARALQLRQAILRFQSAQGLEKTGELDAATSAALSDRYGI